MNLDNLNKRNIRMNLINLKTLNYENEPSVNVRLNKKGKMDTKSIKFIGEIINYKSDLSKALVENKRKTKYKHIILRYSVPKNTNKYSSIVELTES